MIIEWMSWIRSMRTDEILMVLGILLLVDAPRYAYSAVIMAIWDLLKSVWTGKLPGPHAGEFHYRPPVSVIIAGYNEADTIAGTMESVWNRYPCSQMIVADDGSTDGMTEAAMEFAQGRPGILVIRRDRRVGKSSALNMGLHYVTAEVVVTVDADSRLDETAIYELLQLLQMLVLLFYSDRLRHDLMLSAVLPLYPLYQVYMKVIDLFALKREILFREAGNDNFVPVHVRNATWRW